jgi:hypothetical protein
MFYFLFLICVNPAFQPFLGLISLSVHQVKGAIFVRFASLSGIIE